MRRLSPILRAVSSVLLVAFLLLPSWVALAQSKFDVIIHYIEGTPVKGKLEYQVDVSFSVFDSAGKPVKGLAPADVSVTEDSKKVAVTSLNPAGDRPMSVVLLLDTSGSMVGTPMDAARRAAARFVDGLGAADQVAVMSFNHQISRVNDFTKDRQAASSKVNEIKAIENSGTCLYDATYQAVTLAATIPSGRRAIILLTDGVDEIQRGVPCSSKKIEDVIQMASGGSTRVPIFTIGLGDRIDDKSLKRLSEMTGGRYQFSPSAGELANLFVALSEQLKSEYVLRYTSTSAPGAHTLILEVTVQGVKNQNLRQFLLPDLPLGINIIYPSEGSEVRGKTKIVAAVTGVGEPVERVEFLINGVSVGSDTSTPYELEWDFGTAPGGQAISVVARGKENSELARASITIKAAPPEAPVATQALPTLAVAPTQPSTTITTQTTASTRTESSYQLYIIIGVAALAIGGLGLFVIIVAIVRRKGKKTASKERIPPPTFMFKEDKIPADQGPGSIGPLTESKTVDMIGLGPSSPLGTLTVIFSDDIQMFGQVLNLARSPTTLGRAADNDLIFPKDTPVSRHHAIIELTHNQIILSEVISHEPTGGIRRPTYGTFVNEKKLENEPIVIKTGDEIRLGSRTRLKFTRLLPEPPAEQGLETVDGLMVDSAKTVRRSEETHLG